MSTPVDPNKLKVTELKQELAARKLDTKGLKPELVARLAAAMAATPTTEAATSIAPVVTPTTPTPAATHVTTTVNTPSTQQQAPQPTGPKQAAPSIPQTHHTQVSASQAQSAPTSAPVEQDEAEEGSEEEVDITQMSDADRKRARAERFGIPLQQTDGDKKSQRAARFGLPRSELSQSGGLSKSLADVGKIEARKKRFGVVETPSSGVKKPSHHVSVNVSKAQRLGIPVKPDAGAPESDTAKKQARSARFGRAVAQSSLSNEDEERKRKRAERFGGASSGESGKRLRVDKPLEQQTNV